MPTRSSFPELLSLTRARSNLATAARLGKPEATLNDLRGELGAAHIAAAIAKSAPLSAPLLHALHAQLDQKAEQ